MRGSSDFQQNSIKSIDKNHKAMHNEDVGTTDNGLIPRATKITAFRVESGAVISFYYRKCQ